MILTPYILYSLRMSYGASSVIRDTNYICSSSIELNLIPSRAQNYPLLFDSGCMPCSLLELINYVMLKNSPKLIPYNFILVGMEIYRQVWTYFFSLKT